MTAPAPASLPAPPRAHLIGYRQLGCPHSWRRLALQMFRAFIDEQARADPLYAWPGGDDDALQRCWGGWDQLRLFIDQGEPVGMVSWTDHANRLPVNSPPPPLRSWTLTNLYLLPKARGRGLGPLIVDAVRDQLRPRQAPTRPRTGDRVQPNGDRGQPTGDRVQPTGDRAGPIHGPTPPSSLLIASTHGWNTAAQRTFARAGMRPALVELARPTPPEPGEVLVGPRGYELLRGPLRVVERITLDARDHADLAQGLPHRASWYRTAYGLELADRRGPLTDEALYRVSHGRRDILRAAFYWSRLGREVLVRCVEIHAGPRFLRDPEPALDALHALLLHRLQRQHGEGRLPLLLPPTPTPLEPRLRANGWHRELISYVCRL